MIYRPVLTISEGKKIYNILRSRVTEGMKCPREVYSIMVLFGGCVCKDKSVYLKKLKYLMGGGGLRLRTPR